VIVPAAGATIPDSALTSVDLPAPFGPISVTSSPAPTVRSTPSRAVAVP
jgi:hypothetical protein